MFGRPLHRRFAACLALLAVLWGALVPTLAQAVVSTSSRQGWVEVCSASGVLWMRVDGGAKSPTSSAATTGQSGTVADDSTHCPWCPMQGAAGPPPEPALNTTASAQGPLPTAEFISAHPVLLWSKAQSRAPPAV